MVTKFYSLSLKFLGHFSWFGMRYGPCKTSIIYVRAILPLFKIPNLEVVLRHWFVISQSANMYWKISVEECIFDYIAFYIECKINKNSLPQNYLLVFIHFSLTFFINKIMWFLKSSVMCFSEWPIRGVKNLKKRRTRFFLILDFFLTF